MTLWMILRGFWRIPLVDDFKSKKTDNFKCCDMTRSVEKGIEKIKNIEGFEKVKFIILYGSAAEERMIKGSDIDLCIY